MVVRDELRDGHPQMAFTEGNDPVEAVLRQEAIRAVCFPTVAMTGSHAGRDSAPSCIIARWLA
jgi:hypothetical protein